MVVLLDIHHRKFILHLVSSLFSSIDQPQKSILSICFILFKLR